MLPGRLGNATVAVLTITEDEFINAKQIFDTPHNVKGSAYWINAPKEERKYEVVLCQSLDRANIPAYEAVGNIIGHWRPAFIFLVGTAGAVWDHTNKKGRDAELGDVVVGDFIEYVEFTKFEMDKYLRRTTPLDHPSLCLRGDFATPLKYETSWHSLIQQARPTQGEPKVVIGNIAAAEKILGNPNSDFQQYLTNFFDKIVAFEMESAGVARAVFRARRLPEYNPQYLTIRGVSDFINAPQNSETRKKWTPYASSAALAYTKALVDNLLSVGVMPE